MKILLINPNRYRTPPTPPLALEYLHAALAGTRHSSEVLDLCFVEDVSAELQAAVDRWQPDITGITVRNIDTVLRLNNVFFLDEIRDIVEQCQSLGRRVIVGGAGFSFAPQHVLDYLGADYGISGPGELALPALLDQLQHYQVPTGTLINGWEHGINSAATTRRGGVVEHSNYVRQGGLLGFETQKGCLARCPYCAEGKGRVIHKVPEQVVAELQDLAKRGFNKFHLCDTEFNQDLLHCRAFLTTLLQSGLELSWAAYMKTTPYDEELFRLMRATGVHLITVSHPTGPDGIADLQEIRRLTDKHGIRLAVDYLCGLPGDTLTSVRECLEQLRRIAPDTIGVNCDLRLYPELPLTGRILSDPQLRLAVHDRVDRPGDCLRPVFYQQFDLRQLQELIGDDPRFHIEGLDRKTNYERL